MIKKLKGRLSISRINSSRESDYVSIEVGDEGSTCRVISVKVSLQEFAQALLNSADRSCEVELNTSDAIGKTREHKTELVDITEVDHLSGKNHLEAVEGVVEPLEVEGWYSYNLKDEHRNMHKRTRDKEGRVFLSVSMQRFV